MNLNNNRFFKLYRQLNNVKHRPSVKKLSNPIVIFCFTYYHNIVSTCFNYTASRTHVKRLTNSIFHDILFGLA